MSPGITTGILRRGSNDREQGWRQAGFQLEETNWRLSRVPLLTTLGALLVTCLLVPLTSCGTSAASDVESRSEAPAARTTTESAAARPTEPSSGLAAREEAAEEDKYLFALFTKTDDANTKDMRSVFEDAMAEVVDRAKSVAVNVNDPAEREIIQEYGLEHAPMPLVLAVAPNGAITGGFPTKFSEEDLLSAFASPATERCMKSLQDGKLVFLCIQNDETEMNDEARQAVESFAADERFRDATEIVMVDPADEAEKPFLEDLRIDPATKTATTVFLAPPGVPVAIHEGATTKDQLFAELQRASSRGPGGCGPAGCGPR